MKNADFKLSRYDEATKDFWFEVSGESQKELTNKYFEQGMVEVSHVVYSLGDNSWAIQREFIFNTNMMTPKDKDIEDFLKNLAEEENLKLNKAS